MNLLLISNGNNKHYCLIKDLNKLLYHLNNTRLACSSVNIVSMVLFAKTFSTPTYRTARNMVPKKSSCPMKNMAPFNLKIIKNIKIYSASKDSSKSSTEKYQHHKPCGFSYMVVCEVEQHSKAPVFCRGSDADKFLKNVVPMTITSNQEREFQQSLNCHICVTNPWEQTKLEIIVI